MSAANRIYNPLFVRDLILKNARRCNTKKNLRPRVQKRRERVLFFFPKNSWDSKHVLQFILFPESISNSKHVVKFLEPRTTESSPSVKLVFAYQPDILLLDRRSSCSGRSCARGGGECEFAGGGREFMPCKSSVNEARQGTRAAAPICLLSTNETEAILAELSNQ